MREESHLDEMRSAIRGDFERLARRRGRQELLRVAPAGEPEPEPEPRAAISELASPFEPEVAPELELEPAAAAEPQPRSLLDRLFGR